MSIRKEMTDPSQTPITFYSKTKGGIQTKETAHREKTP